MRLVLLGAPGSGKGTQGERLCQKYRIPQISTGDILRAEIAAGTPLGIKAKEHVNSGRLVPDDLILEMMEVRLKQHDVANGFILDGFPRSIPQAEGLERLLAKIGTALDAVLKIDVAKKALMDRLTARWICTPCTAVYNVISSPPKVAGKCDRCGGDLIQRADDTVETVRQRLHVYEAATAPLIDYYDSRGLLVIAHGEGAIDDVWKAVEKALDGKKG